MRHHERMDKSLFYQNYYSNGIFDNRTQSTSTAHNEDDFILSNVSPFLEQYPQLGVHIEAQGKLIKKLQKHHIDLPHEKREALLMFSLWVEDPLLGTEIAQNLGISEEKLHECLDISIFDLSEYSQKLLSILDRLRDSSVQATESNQIQITDEINNQHTYDTQTNTNVLNSEEPKVYDASEQPISPGRIVQSFDHPYLNRKQERVLFEHLRDGTTINQLKSDKSFLDTFDPEEKIRIIRILDQSDTIEEVLASCYVRLVAVFAKQFPELPFADAMNAGNIGLIKSIRKNNPDLGYRFSTYAVWGIRNMIAQESINQKYHIKVPTGVRQDLLKIRRIDQAFRHLFNREPNTNELLNQMVANTDMSIWRVYRALQVIHSKVEYVDSIDAKVTPDSDAEFSDFIPDTTVNIEESVIREDSNARLRTELNRAIEEDLTAQEQRIIVAMYGLGDEEEKTAEELAKEGISSIYKADEIDRIRKNSLAKLQRNKWLRENWTEYMPYFVYSRSAEDVAFRLGLFDDLTSEGTKPQEIEFPKEGTIYKAPEIRQNDIEHSVPDRLVLDIADLNSREQVKELRNQGLNNNEIAQMLELAGSTVSFYAGELLRKGEIQPLPKGRPKKILHQAEFSQTILDRIKELKNQHLYEDEIAKILDMPLKRVNEYLDNLVETTQITTGELNKLERDQNIRGMAVSAETELVKQYLDENPLPTYRELINQAFAGREKRKTGRAPETIELDNRVKELLMQGNSRKKISELIDVPVTTVDGSITRLVTLGEYTPRTVFSSERAKKSAQFQERYSRVTQMINQGMNVLQIAEAFDESVESIQGIIKQLKGKGEINPSIEQLKPLDRFGYVDKHAKVPQGEIYDQIAALRNQGYRNPEIAEKLKIPKRKVELCVSDLIRAGVITIGPRGKPHGSKNK